MLSKEVLSLLSISECVSSPSGAAGVIDTAHGDAGYAALPGALGPLTQAGAGRGSASCCRRRGGGGPGQQHVTPSLPLVALSDSQPVPCHPQPPSDGCEHGVNYLPVLLRTHLLSFQANPPVTPGSPFCHLHPPSAPARWPLCSLELGPPQARCLSSPLSLECSAHQGTLSIPPQQFSGSLIPYLLVSFCLVSLPHRQHELLDSQPLSAWLPAVPPRVERSLAQSKGLNKH